MVSIPVAYKVLKIKVLAWSVAAGTGNSIAQWFGLCLLLREPPSRMGTVLSEATLSFAANT